MTTSDTQSDPKKTASQPLFDPFPEPQAYPKHWDGEALDRLSRPRSSKPKSKSKPTP